MFKTLLKDTFSPSDSPAAASDSSSLSFEKANSIRYVAGYVYSKLYKKLKKSTQSNKEDLCQGIVDMIEEEQQEESDASATWINIIDRGGLFKTHTDFL